MTIDGYAVLHIDENGDVIQPERSDYMLVGGTGWQQKLTDVAFPGDTALVVSNSDSQNQFNTTVHALKVLLK